VGLIPVTTTRPFQAPARSAGAACGSSLNSSVEEAPAGQAVGTERQPEASTITTLRELAPPSPVTGGDIQAASRLAPPTTGAAFGCCGKRVQLRKAIATRGIITDGIINLRAFPAWCLSDDDHILSGAGFQGLVDYNLGLATFVRPIEDLLACCR
jgi:hypothetical protein